MNVSPQAWVRYRLDWILGHVRMSAMPGRWDYRIAVYEPLDSGGEVARGTMTGGQFTVPGFWLYADSARVGMSSLLLARPGQGNWRRGGHTLALNPLHAYPWNATVDVYYEIYGIPEDQIFVTEISLLREGNPPTASLDPPADWIEDVLERKRPELQLRFEESSSRDGRPWIARRKTVSLTGIREGKYVLVVAITPPPPAAPVYRLSPLVISRHARPW
jgi:hypothetical protein